MYRIILHGCDLTFGMPSLRAGPEKLAENELFAGSFVAEFDSSPAKPQVNPPSGRNSEGNSLRTLKRPDQWAQQNRPNRTEEVYRKEPSWEGSFYLQRI